MALGMGSVLSKFMNFANLWVKFKMAAKTAVKINKCKILALV